MAQHGTGSAVCNSQLRDPLTLAVSFMPDPTPFRGCCSFTVEVFDQAVYLEGSLGGCTSLATFCSTSNGESGGGGENDKAGNNTVTPFRRYVPLTVAPEAVQEQELSVAEMELTQGVCAICRHKYGELCLTCFNGDNWAATTTTLAQVGQVGQEEAPVKLNIAADCLTDWGSCHHAYHRHCIGTWLKTRVNCPLCDQEWVHVKSAQLSPNSGYRTRAVAWNPAPSMSAMLTTVKIVRMNYIHKLSDSFLQNCQSLEDVYLCDLPMLEMIGDKVLCGCVFLAGIAMKELPKLASIGNGFLAGSLFLTHVTLKDFPSLISVGDGCLSGCSKLHSVVLIALPKLSALAQGGGFLDGNTQLEKVVLQNIGSLATVGGCHEAWTSHHVSLTSLTLMDCPGLTKIQTPYLAHCTSLTTVVFQNLPKLVRIEEQVLSRCTSLTEVVLIELPFLLRISHSFLCGCTALESIRLGNLPKLACIEEKFLSGCTLLAVAEFAALPMLKEVGPSWLKDCPSLQKVTFRALPNLHLVGEDFLLLLPPEEMRSGSSVKGRGGAGGRSSLVVDAEEKTCHKNLVAALKKARGSGKGCVVQ